MPNFKSIKWQGWMTLLDQKSLKVRKECPENCWEVKLCEINYKYVKYEIVRFSSQIFRSKPLIQSFLIQFRYMTMDGIYKQITTRKKNRKEQKNKTKLQIACSRRWTYNNSVVICWNWMKNCWLHNNSFFIRIKENDQHFKYTSRHHNAIKVIM